MPGSLPPSVRHRNGSSLGPAEESTVAEPSPHQVRRSKRQPMAPDTTSIEDIPAQRNGLINGSSPTHHALRSPRMGRKSLRAYQQQIQSGPVYENQNYNSISTDERDGGPVQKSEVTSEQQEQNQPSNPGAALLQGLDLEQLLAKVASSGGAVDPEVTKQVLDKLLEAAVAAKIIPPQQQQQQQQLPQEPQTQQPEEVVTAVVHNEEGDDEADEDDEEEEESPVDCSSSSPVAEGGNSNNRQPRKSSLLSGGRTRSNADARQLSVRFDPKQVRSKVSLTFNFS